jgi:alkylation response protein AidB-like acyl-CoA dehydrogenase
MIVTLDYALPESLRQSQREAVEFAESWADHATVTEDSWLIGYDREFARELGRRGWLGMTWPARVGGHERTPLERFVVYEALISHGAPIAAAWFADRQIGPTLLEYGSPEQQARWLPEMAAGESAWCIGISEPDAGSDVGSLRTRAVRNGDDWVVSGQKIWTSGALHADWCYLVARTAPNAPKHEGLSELVVDMRSPGIEVRKILDMTGNAHFCEVHFDKVSVPGANLVGREGGSFRQVMRQLEHERGGIDRLVSNYRLYRDVLASGHVDRDDRVVRQELAAIESSYRIGRHLVLRGVLEQAPPGFSAVTKAFCTEHEQRVADFSARALGAHAMLWGPGLGGRAARGVCYAPAYTVMGGTSTILRNVIAERILRLPRVN